MTTEPKKVKLLVERVMEIFVIKQVVNTSWYIPGDHITRDTLKKCCEMPDWEVTVIDNDILKTVLGMLPKTINVL
jgi:hypothetical protein